MVVNNDFVFCHLQKCAGSFIEKFLLNTFKDSYQLWPKHRGISSVLPEHENKLKFGCIRNPWEWYISWWASNSKENTGHLFPKIFTNKRKKDFKRFLYYVMTEDFGIQHDLNGNFIQKSNIGILSYRFYKAFCDKDGQILLDKIIRTESIIEDLSKLFNMELSEMEKVHTSNHKHYTEYYDNDMVELVREKDKQIIRMCKYEY